MKAGSAGTIADDGAEAPGAVLRTAAIGVVASRARHCHVWVAQACARYGAEPWHVLLVVKLDDDGLIARETRYYTGTLEVPQRRADLVEPMAET